MRVGVTWTALLLTACRPTAERGPSEDEAAPVAAAPAALDDDLHAALARISNDDLATHVERLAADSMRGRPTPSSELDAAATYIAKSLAASGVGPGPSGTHRVQVPCGPGGESAANVLGVLPGTLEGSVLVTAHYDHIGEAPAGDDRVFNGANDNASGVAAMLELADAIAHAPTEPRRTVAFVAFCGEEHGFRGSSRFVAEPPVPLRSVTAVLNLEMLGHPDPADPRRAWVTGHDYSTLADWLRRAGTPEGVTFTSGAAIGPAEGNAFERSDNLPFASAGVVAHTIAAGPIDEHYHAVSDEPQLVDTEAMVPIVRALARATLELARAEARPRWTDDAPDRFTRRAPRSARP